MPKFLPTPSARRATLSAARCCKTMDDFYPRPPRGGRPGGKTKCKPLKSFLPTPSARRATSHRRRRTHRRSHFYPRPPRGGRPAAAMATSTQSSISTHALREEGDVDARPANTDPSISTHALREEGDRAARPPADHRRHFYPRPPRGGRRHVVIPNDLAAEHFYPRPPRGGRQPR